VKTAPPEITGAGVVGDPTGDRLVRFSFVVRALHWANALLFGVLIATAAVLYIGQLSVIVGRRELVRQIHVIAGLALPLPVLLALAGPWRRPVSADIRALNRFDADDLRWLRSRVPGRRARAIRKGSPVRLGKFNPGQKLNAAFTAGTIVVMLATGSIMFWNRYFAVNTRTGATFVHDWLAISIGFVVAGHIYMAVSDGDSFWSMVRGWVPADWARRHRSRWYEAMTGRAPKPVPRSRPSRPPRGG